MSAANLAIKYRKQFNHEKQIVPKDKVYLISDYEKHDQPDFWKKNSEDAYRIDE